jgi:hypothetical protein
VTTTSENIDAVKVEIWRQIEQHSKAIEELRSKLKTIKELQDMEKQIAEWASGLPTAPVTAKRYAKMGLTEAVRDALRIFCHEEGRTLFEIRNYLTEHGFPPAVNFSEALNSTIRRLSEQGEAVVFDKNDIGRVTFRFNPFFRHERAKE